MKTIRNLWRELPRATAVSLLIFGVLLLISAMNGRAISLNANLASAFGYTMMYSMTLYLSNAALFMYLDQVYEGQRFTGKRIVIGFVSSFVISVGIIFLLRVVEDVLIKGISWQQYLEDESPANFVVSLVITFVVTLVVHFFYIYKTYNESRVKEQKVLAGVANARFESLKNQIDPHFLFNSLNVLTALIEENPDRAQQFTGALSKIYRYVLEHKDKELVPLSEELEFAQTYMNLLKMRFENSISYELPQHEIDPEAKVVPLALQLLLENTIKHNTVSESKPLLIRIFVDNNYLVIQNNRQPKQVLENRKGVGLQNIVNRYGLLTDRKVLVEETAAEFNIKIPILSKPVSSFVTAQTLSRDTQFEIARDRVEKLKGFYGNLLSYCLVIPVLMFINLTSGGFHWFWFPMLGWGIGLVFHALDTYGFAKAWEERKIKQIMGKENQSNQKWS